MPRVTQAYSRRNVTTSALLALIVLAVTGILAPGFAQGLPEQPAPAQKTAAQPQAASTFVERTREFAKLAPARQTGQPGLAALDDYFLNFFQDAATKMNDPARWAKAQEQIQKADAASEKYIKARMEVVGGVSALTKIERATYLEAYSEDRAAQEAAKGLWLTGRMEYPSAVFIPGQASLTVAGRTAKVYQVSPNLIEPSNLPGGKLDGNIFYLGQGNTSEMAGLNIEGSVVLLEFNSGKQWIEAVQYGARAIVFVEAPTDGDKPGAFLAEAALKQTTSMISIPRYYITRAEAAKLLGKEVSKSINSPATRAVLDSQPGRWEKRNLTAEWLFIPGTATMNPAAESFVQDPARQIVHIQAYKDSNSIVPELSPGGSTLGNLTAVVELVEKFKKEPPQRPVMFSVISDHTNALMGEQNFAFNMFANPVNTIIPELDGLMRERARYAFISQLYGGGPIKDEIENKFRSGSQNVGGQNLIFKDSIIDILSSEANKIRVNRSKLNLRKSRSLLSTIEDNEFATRMAAYTNDLDQLLTLQQLFKKFGTRPDYDKLPEDTKARLVTIYKQITADADNNVKAIDGQIKQITSNLNIRRRLANYFVDTKFNPDKAEDSGYFAARYASVPAVSMITLDMSYGTDNVGFFYTGNFASTIQNFARVSADLVNRLGILANREAEIYSQAKGINNLYIDSVRGIGGKQWNAYLGIKSGVAAQVYHEHIIPALTMMSIEDLRARDYTPQDTLAEVDEARLKRIGDFSIGFLHRLITSEDLGGTYDVRGAEINYLTTELSVRKQDRFSVGVPKLPQAGALVTVDAKPQLPSNIPMLGQVRPYPVLITNDRGSVTFRGGAWREGSLLVFGYDPAFKRLQSALDFGMGEKKFNSAISAGRTTQYMVKTIIATEMDKIDLLGLTQPLALAAATSITVIDAIQESPTPILSTMGIRGVGSGTATKRIPTPFDGTAFIMIDQDMPFKLRIGPGLAINASSSNPNGDGFSAKVGILPNLVLTSASDMLLLTRFRLDLLATKGVKNDTATAYQNQADALVKEAKQNEAMGNNSSMMINAEEGRGLAYQAYLRGLATVNDLIKAVVIFLALVIPFCFFLTKLVSPFTDINRQLTLFGVVFAAMAVLLRFVHPAFEIAKTPEVVILAFIILGLAIFVATVLISKFNSSMNQMVEESQLAESTEASQGRLAGVAFLVGINNMKRRRIRTTLTCVTIVLVTFTMLSVISVGQGTDPATRPTSPESPYNGFLFANPGLSKIDPLQLHRLKAHYEGGATVVSRAWAQKLSSYGEYMGYNITPVQPIPGAQIPVLNARVLVGLEVAEKNFLPGGMPIQPGGRWFSSDMAQEIILSTNAAELMGIKPGSFEGQYLEMGGRKLKLVGLLDDQTLERMRDQGDVPILPMLEAVSQQREDEEAAAAKDNAQLDLGGAMAGGTGSTVARAMNVAFLPIDLARSIADAEYRSLSVRFDSAPSAELNAAQAWKKANELIQYQTARIAVGITKTIIPTEGGRPVEPGQYAMTSSNSTQVGGVLKIAVPIILAATIILNTMLGSVMERRREVAIYNAIGLNPTHVMMFFLAESLVFGMIGSVAGYLIGQILAIIFTKLNVGLNLNYSSLSVMVVIFLAIATVLISTIYPAMMAARAAVPSGQRKWSLPPTEGDEMSIKFPFSYDAERVLGVCAYLRDFMKQNSEASTGSFLAELGPIGRVGAIKVQAAPTGAPVEHTTYAMVFDIAPAPYDLGVNQKLEVYAYYDTTVKAHMLAVHITRMTGERSNWLSVNQPFLESLRKRLLGWRSQKSDTHEAYYREGQRMFADAGDLPVVNGSQERA
jgi:hypothetical protein